MVKKLTQEEFISSCSATHQGKYTYLNTNYVNSRTKVSVCCHVHGEFLVKPDHHKRGTGCAKCFYSTNKGPSCNDPQDYIEECNIIHGGEYTYERTEYKRATGKVTVTCRQHGDFMVRASDHKAGSGCPACGVVKSNTSRTKSLDKFVEDARSVHDVKYSYENVVYKGSTVKVSVTCPTHGEFIILPHHLLAGRGCTGCAEGGGFDDNLPGTLYILSSGDLMKVGITNKEVNHRISRVSSSSKKNFQEVAVFKFDTGKTARMLESRLLKHLRATYESPTEKFEGYTECFYLVEPNEFIQRFVLNEEIICLSL